MNTQNIIPPDTISTPTNPQSTPPLPSFPNHIHRLKKSMICSLALSAIVLGGIFLAAEQSLPGSSLYGIKTNGLEKIVGLTHVHSKSKANYQITLLKHRLEETKALAKADTVSDQARDALTTQILKQSTTLTTIIEESIDSAFPKTELLYTLNEFASVAGAIEIISEADAQLTLFGDTTETVRQDTVRLYKDRAESFVATETPAAVYTYLEDHLLSVQTELETPDLDKTTINRAENYLNRVSPAISAGTLAKAIVAVGEAYRIIKVTTYSGVIADPSEKIPLPDTTTTTTTSTPKTVVATSTLP